MSNPQRINELSESYVTAAYFDQNGNPYIPTAVSYKLDDLTNNVNIIPWTVFSTSGTTTDQIPIASASNALTVATNKTERRQVALRITAPGGLLRYDNIFYDRLNIYGVP